MRITVKNNIKKLPYHHRVKFLPSKPEDMVHEVKCIIADFPQYDHYELEKAIAKHHIVDIWYHFSECPAFDIERLIKLYFEDKTKTVVTEFGVYKSIYTKFNYEVKYLITMLPESILASGNFSSDKNNKILLDVATNVISDLFDKEMDIIEKIKSAENPQLCQTISTMLFGKKEVDFGHNTFFMGNLASRVFIKNIGRIRQKAKLSNENINKITKVLLKHIQSTYVVNIVEKSQIEKYITDPTLSEEMHKIMTIYKYLT